MTNNKKTTIEISVATKTSLDLMKIHPRQSYDEIIRKKILEKANEHFEEDKFGSRKK